MGTLDVESLGSFLLRLSILHGMQLDMFLKLLVAENSNKDLLEHRQIELAFSKKPFASYDTAFNSPCLKNATIISLLHETYGNSWFSSLGLFKLYPVFQTFRGVFSRSFRWCPTCWRDDLSQHGVPYFRAHWGFEEVSRCRVHERELLDRCPKCGACIRGGYRQHLHICKKCGFDLSKAHPRPYKACEKPIVPPDLMDLLWCIQDDENWAPEIYVRRACFYGLRNYFSDSGKFAKNGRRTLPSEVRLCERDEPTFVGLRRICNYYGLRLSDIISREEVQTSFFFEALPTKPVENLYPKIEKKRANVSKSKMLEKLKRLMNENARSPKPVTFYAGQLGISADGLAHRFPRLYRRMADYYKCHVRSSRVLLGMEIDTVLELMRSEKDLDRGVKKVCQDLMVSWGFPKNLSREHIKKFRDEVLSDLRDAEV